MGNIFSENSLAIILCILLGIRARKRPGTKADKFSDVCG
jgi:hypothetical protein